MKKLKVNMKEPCREVTLDEALAEIDRASADETFLVQTSDGNAHVIPSVVFEKIVSGEMKITDLDDYEKIMERIVQEWIDIVKIMERIVQEWIDIVRSKEIK
ncbi:MAG TPA: hypothetical protein VLH56_11260 [Dissulfurispiraceae bacterium]|nr:hypothetical protein [Dissulfurispiraceae bacterium]